MREDGVDGGGLEGVEAGGVPGEKGVRGGGCGMLGSPGARLGGAKGADVGRLPLVLHVLDGQQVVGHLDAAHKRHEVLVASPSTGHQDLIVCVYVLILIRFYQFVLKLGAPIVWLLRDANLDVGEESEMMNLLGAVIL